MSSAQSTTDKPRTRKFEPATALRLVRLQAGITLQEVATEAGTTLFRASILERYPERSRSGELDRLHQAISAIGRRREQAKAVQPREIA
ncbi:MAG TPA: hypothetical protein VNM92_13810 [Thermoanaerobaculia bacterium]|nr:hypothetical protein [Thermoanaerobaculia bacterium]